MDRGEIVILCRGVIVFQDAEQRLAEFREQLRGMMQASMSPNTDEETPEKSEMPSQESAHPQVFDVHEVASPPKEEPSSVATVRPCQLYLSPIISHTYHEHEGERAMTFCDGHCNFHSPVISHEGERAVTFEYRFQKEIAVGGVFSLLDP